MYFQFFRPKFYSVKLRTKGVCFNGNVEEAAELLRELYSNRGLFVETKYSFQKEDDVIYNTWVSRNVINYNLGVVDHDESESNPLPSYRVVKIYKCR